MTGSPEDVAAELRALARALATRTLDGTAMRDTTERLRAVRIELERAPALLRWHELDPHDAVASRAYHDRFGPLRGTASVVAPPLACAPGTHAGRPAVIARLRCDLRYEGPPGLVHGGIVAACFDEVLAIVMRDHGGPAFTTELRVWYRRPVPVDRELEIVGWLEDDDGRRARGRAECRVTRDPDVRAEATAHFTRPGG